LNSTYGRSALLKQDSTAIKTTKNLVSAQRNASEWFNRVRRAEVAGMSLEVDGPDAIMMVSLQDKHLRFTNIQQACAILSNSKALLIHTQAKIIALYDPKNITNCYTDTGKKEKKLITLGFFN